MKFFFHLLSRAFINPFCFSADCSRYYSCFDGEIVQHGQCAEGLLFDPIERNCKPEDQVDCGLLPKPECPEVGLHYIPHECKTSTQN